MNIVCRAPAGLATKTLQGAKLPLLFFPRLMDGDIFLSLDVMLYYVGGQWRRSGCISCHYALLERQPRAILRETPHCEASCRRVTDGEAHGAHNSSKMKKLAIHCYCVASCW